MTERLAEGHFVYLAYDVAGEPWHEFQLGKKVRGCFWTVRSPDEDEWIQELALSDDVIGLRAGNAAWRLPPGLGGHVGHAVYRFKKKPLMHELEDFLKRSEKLSEEFLAGEEPGAAIVDPAGARPARSVSGKGPQPPPLGDAREVKPDALAVGGFAAMNFTEFEWIAVTGPSVAPGTSFSSDAVKALLPVTTLGDWALLADAGGVAVLRRCKSGDGMPFLAQLAKDLRAVDKDETPRSLEDARILPNSRNRTGKRFMPFPEQVAKMHLEKFGDDDWILVGPRSAPYVLQEIAKTNVGAATRSVTWKHENAVPDDSHNGQLHEVISEAVDLFVTVDQVDAFNLAGVESLLRTLQYIEFEVRKKREAKLQVDNSYYFRSRPRNVGGAIIDPALLEYIAKRASQDSAVLKEQRKAAEEAALARKGGKV